MRTDKRTKQTPWQAIDVMTNECVGWYAKADDAHRDSLNATRALSVLYRPLKSRSK